MGESTESGASGHKPGEPGRGGATMTQSPLGELLSRHKNDRAIGDARLATIANDRVGIANFVTRSTIRNWAAGSVSRASNWRQLAAVASALQLNLREADELMRVGGCDPISDLLRVVRDDDAVHVVYWATEIPTPDDTEAPPASPAVEPAPIWPPDGRPADSEPQAADRRGVGSSMWLAPFGFIVIGALAAVGLWYLLTSTGSAASPSSEPTAETVRLVSEPGKAQQSTEPAAPTTTVDAPAAGATITGDLVASGTARHPDGVEQVELVIKDLQLDSYWNPVIGDWQPEFTRFVVPVAEGATLATWAYRMPIPLTSGDYRVRAWARAAAGNGDPLGPLSDFSVQNPAALAITPGAAAAPDGPNQLVVAPPDDGFPRSTLDMPETGVSTTPSVLISGTAEDPDGVAYVELILRRLGPTDEYWNPAIDGWQGEFIRFAVDVDEPGGAEVTWQWSPPDALAEGEYRARVWAKGSDGGRDEARTLSDFSVTAPIG